MEKSGDAIGTVKLWSKKRVSFIKILFLEIFFSLLKMV